MNCFFITNNQKKQPSDVCCNLSTSESLFSSIVKCPATSALSGNLLDENRSCWRELRSDGSAINQSTLRKLIILQLHSRDEWDGLSRSSFLECDNCVDWFSNPQEWSCKEAYSRSRNWFFFLLSNDKFNLFPTIPTAEAHDAIFKRRIYCYCTCYLYITFRFRRRRQRRFFSVVCRYEPTLLYGAHITDRRRLKETLLWGFMANKVSISFASEQLTRWVTKRKHCLLMEA